MDVLLISCLTEKKDYTNIAYDKTINIDNRLSVASDIFRLMYHMNNKSQKKSYTQVYSHYVVQPNRFYIIRDVKHEIRRTSIALWSTQSFTFSKTNRLIGIGILSNIWFDLDLKYVTIRSFLFHYQGHIEIHVIWMEHPGLSKIK